MDEFVTEIQEDLRREQILTFWKNYAKYIIAGIVAFVLGVSGFLYWQSNKQERQMADALLFEQTLKITDLKERREKLAILSASPSAGYRALALFEAAEQEASPAKAYRALAQNPRLEPSLKELASLKAIIKDMGYAPAQTLLDEVTQLVKVAGPWREQAFEIQAMLLLETGRRNDARQIFENLSKSPAAPEGVRARASAMLEMISRL